jgi:hypothetical protein
LTIQINLTPAQRNNILAFLQRSQITGKEVPAFSEIFTLIQRAQPGPSHTSSLPLSKIQNPKSEI